MYYLKIGFNSRWANELSSENIGFENRRIRCLKENSREPQVSFVSVEKSFSRIMLST